MYLPKMIVYPTPKWYPENIILWYGRKYKCKEINYTKFVDIAV